MNSKKIHEIVADHNKDIEIQEIGDELMEALGILNAVDELISPNENHDFTYQEAKSLVIRSDNDKGLLRIRKTTIDHINNLIKRYNKRKEELSFGTFVVGFGTKTYA